MPPKLPDGAAVGFLKGIKGVPLDSGLATPMGEGSAGGLAGEVDPFEEFNSVTLHHEGDGEDGKGGRGAGR